MFGQTYERKSEFPCPQAQSIVEQGMTDIRFPPASDFARMHISQTKLLDPVTDESEDRKSDSSCHSANLAVLTFPQDQPEPAVRDIFAETDRR